MVCLNINKNFIEYVTSYTDLGVIFNSKLCFNRHIDMIMNKILYNLDFILCTYMF